MWKSFVPARKLLRSGKYLLLVLLFFCALGAYLQFATTNDMDTIRKYTFVCVRYRDFSVTSLSGTWAFTDSRTKQEALTYIVSILNNSLGHDRYYHVLGHTHTHIHTHTHTHTLFLDPSKLRLASHEHAGR